MSDKEVVAAHSGENQEATSSKLNKTTQAPKNRSPNVQFPNFADVFLLIPPATWHWPTQLAMIARRLPINDKRLQTILLYYTHSPPVFNRDLGPVAHFLQLWGDVSDKDANGGYKTGFAVIVVGVLVNHVRRVLFPETAIGHFSGPMGNLKLAAGSPALFLAEAPVMGRYRPWLASPIWYGLGTLATLYVADETKKSLHQVIDDQSPKAGEGGTDGMARMKRKIVVIAAVVNVAWVLTMVEYAHARTAHVVSVGIAFWKLTTGSEAHRRILWILLDKGFTAALLRRDVCWWTYGCGLATAAARVVWFAAFNLSALWYLVFGIYPVVKLAVASAVGLGKEAGGKEWRWAGPRPGLLAVIGGWVWTTGYLARYSNKYYMMLELTNLLLVVWWVVVAAVLYGAASVRDWMAGRRGGKAARSNGQM